MSICDDNGWTPLHVAAHKGDILITSSLFKRHADPSAVNSEGHTATDVAARAGHADCVTLLRLAALSASEKEADKDSLSFSIVLDDFSKGLQEKRFKGTH